MGLKKAIVTFTNRYGETVTRHLPIKSVVFDYAGGFVDVLFTGFVSEEARTKGAPPELFSQRIPFDPESESEMGLVLSVSDALWVKIAQQPFINDYSELDTNGKMKMVLKTLSELNAEVVDA